MLILYDLVFLSIVLVPHSLQRILDITLRKVVQVEVLRGQQHHPLRINLRDGPDVVFQGQYELIVKHPFTDVFVQCVQDGQRMN